MPFTVVVLLCTTCFFALAAVVLFAMVFETLRPRSLRTLRRWRYAYSKRKEIGLATRRAAEAKKAAYEAYHEAEAVKRDAFVKAEEAAKVVKDRAAAKMRLAEGVMKQAGKKVLDADNAIEEMGAYIIAEQSGEHIKAIRANNYHAKEKKIVRSVEKAKKHGYDLPAEGRRQLSRMLKQAHEKAVRVEAERERQAEIKAQIREEERRQREIDKAIKDAEKEEKMRRKALEQAIKLLGSTHSEELDKLKAELAEAQAAMQRTKSMAEQTKAGHIYVISNIGSFGRDVFKVGMTRRLEPMDRVRELGDASVPFSFDVHAMISSNNAPALEAALHRTLSDRRVNKVNLRKEYFRVELSEIIDAVKSNHGEVEYTVEPEALEYFESCETQEAWSGE